MRPFTPRAAFRFQFRVPVLAFLLLALPSLPVAADPRLGFVEDWPGTSLQNWGGGALYSNPGTGGVRGEGDGFLIVSSPVLANLGTVNFDPAYTGDWCAAGIEIVRVWLKDVGTPENLQIHFSLGNAFNFWQYNVAFNPLPDQWQEFIVDLASPNWTRIIGFGTFDQAIMNVDRVHLRHDLPPFTQSPDRIQGDFGIDRLTLTSFSTPARPTSWGLIKALYR